MLFGSCAAFCFSEVIMPYPGISDPAVIQKMDDCVQSVMGQGHDKGSAIAICRSSIINGASLEEAIAKLKAGELLPEPVAEFAPYPWDECVRQQTARYGDQATAEKVCGAIKAKYGAQGTDLLVPAGADLGDLLKEVEASLSLKPRAQHRPQEVSGELVELAAGPTQTRTLQVLRAGDFTDMHGLEIAVSEADLPVYVQQSNALLTREEVPVDLGHPTDAGAPAAAWYKRFFTKVVNGVQWVCAEVELSALGVQSLADNLYKYFSATIDTEAKEIIGGGFVNRPAVSGQQPVGSLSSYLRPREEVSGMGKLNKGAIAHLRAQATALQQLLQPAGVAELALDSGMVEKMQGMIEKMLKLVGPGLADDPKDQGAMDEVSSLLKQLYQTLQAKPGDQTPAPEQAPAQGGMMSAEQWQAALSQAREQERTRLLAEQQKHDAELAAAVANERVRVLAEQKRASDIRSLAVKLTSGKRAFWHTPAEMEELLTKFSDDDRVLVGALLEAVQTRGLVDLTEKGHGRDASKKEFPSFARKLLADWTKKGETLDAFFAANPELGKPEEYDLAEFKK